MDEFAELENDLSEEYDSSSLNPKLDGNLKKGLIFLSLFSMIVIIGGIFLINSSIEEGEKAKKEDQEKGLLYCSTLYGPSGEVIGTDNSDTEYCNQEDSLFDDFCCGIIFLLIGCVGAMGSILALFRNRVQILNDQI